RRAPRPVRPQDTSGRGGYRHARDDKILELPAIEAGCHDREGSPPRLSFLSYRRRPVSTAGWIPAFAGMTIREDLIGGAGLQLDVIFEADPLDQPELGFDEIHLVLFAVEHVAQQIAGGEIARALAIGDRRAQGGDRGRPGPQ